MTGILNSNILSHRGYWKHDKQKNTILAVERAIENVFLTINLVKLIKKKLLTQGGNMQYQTLIVLKYLTNGLLPWIVL